MRSASELHTSSRLRNPFFDYPNVGVVSWENLGLPSKPTLRDIGRSSPALVITDVKFGPSAFRTEYRRNRAFFLFKRLHADCGARSYTLRNGTMAETLCQKLEDFLISGRRPGEATSGRFEIRPSETNSRRAIIDFVPI